MNLGGSSGGSTSAPFDPSTTLAFYEDFTSGGYFGTGVVSSENAWASSVLGTGALSAGGAGITSDTNHPGVMELKVSANNDGAGVVTGVFGSTVNKPFFTGGGVLTYETLIYISALSNGTDNANVAVGIGNEPSWSALANDLYFIYASSTSANWIMSCSKASSSTQTASSTAVAAGWTKLKFVVNAAGTSVEFFVNGASIGTVVSNIPVVALPAYTSYRKVLGTGAMYLGVDYIKIDKTFTSSR